MANIKTWLTEREMDFVQEPFYDTIKLKLTNRVELVFDSKLAYHKDPEEWQKELPEKLNWQIGAFYVY